MPGTFDIRCLYPSPLIASGRGGWTGTTYTFIFLYSPTKQSCMSCICGHRIGIPQLEGQPLSGTGESGDSALYELQYYDRYRYE